MYNTLLNVQKDIDLDIGSYFIVCIMDIKKVYKQTLTVSMQIYNVIMPLKAEREVNMRKTTKRTS